MSIHTDDSQSIAEFTVSLDRQLRRRTGMGVEKFKILKNIVLATLITIVGLDAGMDPYHIIAFILAVGAPDALELFLGNGLRISLEDDEDDE